MNYHKVNCRAYFLLFSNQANLPLWNYSNKWGVSDFKTKITTGKSTRMNFHRYQFRKDDIWNGIFLMPSCCCCFFLLTLVKFDDTWLVHGNEREFDQSSSYPYSRLPHRIIQMVITISEVNNVENKPSSETWWMKKRQKTRVNIEHLVETFFLCFCYMHVCYRLDLLRSIKISEWIKLIFLC